MRVLRREAGGITSAIVLHAALCSWLLIQGRAAAPTRLEEPESPVDVEIEPSPTAEPEPSPNPVAADLAPPNAPHAPSTARTSSPVSATLEAAPAASGAAPPEQPLNFSPTIAPSLSNEPLGMGGRNPFLGNVPDVGGPPAAPSAAPEANMAPGIQRSLHDALAAHDREIGLDTGGPLLAVAEEATRPSDTPENSRAVFEVTIDANGIVTGIRVVDASQERQAWDRVALRMGATLRTRRIPLRGQKNGVVVTLRVDSRYTLPSGAKPGGSLDPKFGSDEYGAEAHVGFDVSDIGARPHRQVHARVIGERAL